MRIAFVLTAIDNLGPFIVARDIIKNIVSKTEKIDVFYFKEPKSPLSFEAEAKKISFFTAVDFTKYDIVHSSGFLADVYVSIHLKKKAGWVSTLHQKIKPNYRMDYNNFVATVLEFFWLSRLKRSSCVITLTREMKDYYLPKFKGKQLDYIYNGVEKQSDYSKIPEYEFRRIQQLKEHTCLLGISARLVYLKGIDQVINALSLSADYSLLLIGDGIEKESLLNLARKLNIEDRVFFIGYKKNPIDYLIYSDLYVMSSRTEGFGLSVVEAASQKIPVVCNDLPVYRELFSDQEVVRFQLDDPGSIINALNYAMQNRMHLSQNIYNKYYNNYTAKGMAENYFSLYLNLTKANTNC